MKSRNIQGCFYPSKHVQMCVVRSIQYIPGRCARFAVSLFSCSLKTSVCDDPIINDPVQGRVLGSIKQVSKTKPTNPCAYTIGYTTSNNCNIVLYGMFLGANSKSIIFVTYSQCCKILCVIWIPILPCPLFSTFAKSFAVPNDNTE